MSNHGMESTKKRGQNLLVVEGKHKKNKFFRVLFQCFPEIQIDIDLPFVISKARQYETLRYKNDFINIILVFDYERHDPRFQENKIIRIQAVF